MEDDRDRGRIVHVRFDGVLIDGPNGAVTTIGHAPIAELSVLPHLIKLLEIDVPVSDRSGYNNWREARGGVFEMPPAEVVRTIEEAFKNARPR
ncbi:MAG: hypothetical protein ACKVU4_09390 [Phycisphaerales bacterium]